MSNFKTKRNLITDTVMTSGRYRAPANALINSMIENFEKFCADYSEDVFGDFPVTDARSGSIKAIGDSFLLGELIKFYPTILKLSDFFSSSELDLDAILSSTEDLQVIEGNKDYQLFKELYLDPLLMLVEKKRAIDENFVPFTDNRFIPSFSIASVSAWLDKLDNPVYVGKMLTRIRTTSYAHLASNDDLNSNDLPFLANIATNSELPTEFSALVADCKKLITNWDENHPSDGLSLITALSSISSARLEQPLLGFETDLTFWDAQASVLPLIGSTAAIATSFDLKRADHAKISFHSFKGWDSALNHSAILNSKTVASVSVSTYLENLLFTLCYSNRRGVNLFNHISLPLSGFIAYPLIHECARREISSFYPTLELNGLDRIEGWAKARQNRLVSEFEADLATSITNDKLALPEAIKRKWIEGANLNVGELYSKLTDRRGTYEQQLVVPSLPCNMIITGLETDVVAKGKLTLRSNVPFIEYSDVPVSFGASSKDGIVIRSPMLKNRIIQNFEMAPALQLLSNKYDNDNAATVDVTLDYSFLACLNSLKTDLRGKGKMRVLTTTDSGDTHVRDVVNNSGCNYTPTFDSVLVERIGSRDRLLGFEGSLTEQTITVDDTIYRTDSLRLGNFCGRLVSDVSRTAQNELITGFVKTLFSTYEQKNIVNVKELLEYKPTFSNKPYRKRLADMDSLFTTVVDDVARVKRLLSHPYSTSFLKNFTLDLSHIRLIQEESVLINSQLLGEIQSCVKHEVENFVASGLLPASGITEIIKPILDGTFDKTSFSRLRGGKNLPLVSNLLSLAFGSNGTNINMYNFIYAMEFLDAVMAKETV